MKKIVSLALLLVTVISINAQINTNIWGVTVGKSTKQHVEAILKKNGFTKLQHLEDNVIVITDYSGSGTIRFGGIPWQSMHFCFYKNILYMINFFKYKAYYDGYSYEYIKTQISEPLLKKYSKYCVENQDNILLFHDGINSVSFREDNEDISLNYYNYSIWEKKRQEEYNEF